MAISLDLNALRNAYAGGLTPTDVVNLIYDRIENMRDSAVWITLVPREAALDRGASIEERDRSALPLYGVPFAVKDNIDCSGLPTTAGCPAFARLPGVDATVVRKLFEAGAILIGKTNMDQFATGLVGTRSPYGVCSSAFNPEYIAGGSSSGSAVAVANGLVSFALGTDTAGSGRVPAAFNNIVGLKPTRGLIGTGGVVPACRSLDCVSIFALTAGDAAQILELTAGDDDHRDPYSRPLKRGAAPWLNVDFHFGVPRQDQLEFFGDSEAQTLFDLSIDRLTTLGGTPVEIDFTPFKDAAALLYAGSWVAERLAAVRGEVDVENDELHPVVRSVILGARNFTAADAFADAYRLAGLRREADKTWQRIDLMLLPTTGTTYTIAEVLADPLQLNSNLGYYTNFVNLLDLAGVAVPAGIRTDGLPFGVTLLGPAFTDSALLKMADRLHRAAGGALGALEHQLDKTMPMDEIVPPPGCILIAVVGAHLTEQPLNYQLTARKARLAFAAKSASGYKLFALANTSPPKPGLVREPEYKGVGIDLEVWAMPTEAFGSFVAEIPPPLGIGTVELASGAVVKGFVCEPYALQNAMNITAFGGWKSYLAHESKRNKV